MELGVVLKVALQVLSRAEYERFDERDLAFALGCLLPLEQ